MELKKWTEGAILKLRKLGVKEWGMVLLAGICCLIIVFPSEEKESLQVTEQQTVEYARTETYTREEYVNSLEKRLTELLVCVEEVGEVRVMITVESSIEKTVLKDKTTAWEQNTENDSAGGSRSSESSKEEENTIFAGGENEPYILQETYPKITGVVVLAQGSGKGSVDYDILNAVQVLFDVPAHKIKIMKMK